MTFVRARDWQQVFQSLDRDGDGKMDAEPFEAISKKDSPSLEKDELPLNAPLTKKVPSLEKDLEALKQARAAVAAGDKDGDKQMDKEEFRAQMAKSEAFRKVCRGPT